MERITNSGAPLVAGWETESSSSRLQKRLTAVAEEMAADEEEARIATTNRKTAATTAATIQIATARAEITAARRTTTTTDKERTGPRWLPVLETRRPQPSPQSTTMSPQWFKKIRKQLERQSLTPASQNLHFGKKKNNRLFLFLHFYFISLFSLSPAPFYKTIRLCFWILKSPFLFAQKKALFHIKHAPTNLFPNPTSHIIIRKKVNRLPLV